MANFQTKIPEHVEDIFNDLFAPGGLFPGQHEQKVDV